MSDSAKDTSTSSTENLYKNKSIIRGITLILTEIIEENENDKKKEKDGIKDKRSSNLKIPKGKV